MTANHPYPKHVMEAVAVAILNYYEYLGGRNTSAVEIANVALTGLWEASQVDDVETMKTLPHAAEIAAAEQRGKEQGWDEAVTTQIQRLISGNPDVERFQMPANPYRADRLEGDDD